MGGDDVDLCSWELPLEGDLLSGRGLSYKAVNVGFSHSRPDVPLYLKDWASWFNDIYENNIKPNMRMALF